jgi:hypothetical protein
VDVDGCDQPIQLAEKAFNACCLYTNLQPSQVSTFIIPSMGSIQPQ